MNGTASRYRGGHSVQTMRADVWWTQPLLVFLGLSTFIVYSTWAAFQGTHYFFGNYISPFYSPELFGDSPHSWFGPKPVGGRAGLFFLRRCSILWAPGGFRLTCYYYRGAYYKAFWADPPACTVGEPRKTYLGERSFPLIMQNVHRYFLYLALIFHSDSCTTMFGKRCGLPIRRPARLVRDRRRHARAGDQCRSAGRLHFWLSFAAAFGRRISRSILEIACVLSRLRTASSCLNRRHMMWAWMSLFWVGFSDLYVRLCSMGIWHDSALSEDSLN